MSVRENDTEEVEQVDESWDKGSSRSYITDRNDAGTYLTKAKSFLKRAESHKDNPSLSNSNKLQYHKEMAKFHKAGYHGMHPEAHHNSAAAKKQVKIHKDAIAALKSSNVSVEEQDLYGLDEESIAASTLKPGSRTVDNPKSKIEAITSVLGAMHTMRKDDLIKWHDQAMALVGKEADSLPAGASADANASSIDMKGGKGPKTRDAMPKLSVKEDVEEMFVGEELTEEFKDKATTLFEAAVNARALVEVARLEEEYEERLEEEVTSIAEAVEKNLDVYLDYVVEKWMEDNQVAIESSLRNELAEEFISGLKNLFVEHYIEVPEEKVDVVESLAAKVEELEEALDETINENAELKTVIAEAERLSIIDSLSEGLTMTQSEKFFSLAEGVDFNGDLDNYKHKLEIVKNTYFTGRKSSSTNIEEETFEVDTPTQVLSSDPMVNKYVQAISRTVKK